MTEVFDDKARFKQHDRNAVLLERAGSYGKAQKEWAKAAEYAPNHRLKIWCEHRAAFCERMVKRPFRGE